MSLGELTDSLQVAVNNKIHNYHVRMIRSVLAVLESPPVLPPCAAFVHLQSPLISLKPGSGGQPEETGEGGGRFPLHAEE